MHPRTFHGKIFCILYPVAGIIVIGMLLSNIGSVLAKFIESCDSFWTSVFDAKAKVSVIFKGAMRCFLRKK